MVLMYKININRNAFYSSVLNGKIVIIKDKEGKIIILRHKFPEKFLKRFTFRRACKTSPAATIISY